MWCWGSVTDLSRPLVHKQDYSDIIPKTATASCRMSPVTLLSICSSRTRLTFVWWWEAPVAIAETAKRLWRRKWCCERVSARVALRVSATNWLSFAVALLFDHLRAPLAIQEILKVNHFENCICEWCRRSKILYFLQQFQNNLGFSWIWCRQVFWVCVFPITVHWLCLMPSKWREDAGKGRLKRSLSVN